MNCISCSKEHNEKFCPNCGERSGVKKITFSSIIEEALSTITNLDKGLLFNIKALSTNPRKIITDYIHGKRKGVLNPISFLIISVTLYLIVEAFFKVPKEPVELIINSEEFERGAVIGRAAGKFLKTNFKYFWILSILFFGFSL